jgi:hypothetical protein
MYSETPDIIPFTSPFKSEMLTQAELESLKEGTLRRTGRRGKRDCPYFTRPGDKGHVYGAALLCPRGA